MPDPHSDPAAARVRTTTVHFTILMAAAKSM
jgi:hypothetical protein